MKLGSLIKAYMEKNSLSLRELAKEIDCHHATLHRLVCGQPVRMDVFSKILTWIVKP